MIALSNHIILFVALCLMFTGVLKAQMPSTMNAQGTVRNTGTIKIHGDATIVQDTIKGRVEYLRDNSAEQQKVAHTVYHDLYFEGASTKMLQDATRPLVSTNLFVSNDSNVIFDLIQTSRIDVLGTVNHNGLINPTRMDGLMRFVGTSNQNVSGTGLIPVGEVDNSTGISISAGGGLRFVNRLDLQNGNVTNTASDNIVMLPGAWLWRDDAGSMSSEPDAITTYSARYYGKQPQLTAKELSVQPTKIASLKNDNVAGLTLGNDVWVNDSLILGGHIYTEEEDTVRHILYFTNTIAPQFRSGREEVDGTIVRTNLLTSIPMVMNNQHTTLRFEDSTARGDVNRLQLRVKPQMVPEPVPVGADKVRRFFQFQAQNSSGVAQPDSSFNVEFGYAWRATQVDTAEGTVVETPALLQPSLDSLVLQRLVVDKYATDGNSIIPTIGNNGWRYSVATNIRSNGDFAIGLSSTSTVWVLRTRMFLEGAMREYGENIKPLMAADLVKKKLMPMTPPAGYPYSLDPNRANYVVVNMPDTIVDWVVVEFRKSPSSVDSIHYQTGLLTSNGEIVDPSTFLPLPIRGIQQGSYHLVFRHRNHLAIMTEDKEIVAPANSSKLIDLASGVGIFGGATSMKLLGTVDGKRLFGLAAGDATQDSKIARIDDNHLIYQNIDMHGYNPWDIDLDGVISTRDWNISWNNRERVSVVP